jgi:hypothetical protein
VGKVTAEVSAGLIHGLLRYVDEEWGDRFARWKHKRLKAKLKAFELENEKLKERLTKYQGFIAGIADASSQDER